MSHSSSDRGGANHYGSLVDTSRVDVSLVTARIRRAGRAVRRGMLRRATVLGAVLGGVLVLLPASPALARIQDDGADPGQGLTALETFLIFVGIPVGAFLLIALLVMAPSIARGPRYRADRRWAAQPQVFGVREDLDASDADEPAEEGGGASARW